MALKNAAIGPLNNLSVKPEGTGLIVGTDAALRNPLVTTNTAAGVTAECFALGGGFELLFTLTDAVVPHTDEGGTGSSGSLRLGDFNNTDWDAYIPGDSFIALDTVAAASASNASMVIHWGVGTTAADAGDGALTGTEDNIILSAAASALSSQAGVNYTNIDATAANIVVASANGIYLNESGTAATSGANDALTINGRVSIILRPSWVKG